MVLLNTNKASLAMASTEHDHSKCKKAAPHELSLND